VEKYDHEQIHYQTDTGMRFDIVNTSDSFVAMHWHNSLEIIMVLSGYMDVNISGTTAHIEKGGFCVINSKTIHSTVCKRQCRYLILQITYDLLSSNIPGIETVTLNCVCPSLSQRRGCYEQVADLLEKLAELYETPKDNEYRLVFHVLVFELLYQLFKNFKVAIDPVLKKQSANNVRRVGVVLQYVRQHYNENISLEDAARLMALNREYFARLWNMSFLSGLNTHTQM
jgi:hypothetical protein